MTQFVGNSITLPRMAAAPSSPVAGDAYYNTTANTAYVYNGTAWVDLAASGGTGGGNTIYYQTTQPTSANAGDIWYDSDDEALGDIVLTDSVSSTSTSTAATPNSVKQAYDRGTTGVTDAATAQTTANAAIPKSTVTTAGDVIYATGSAAVARLALGTAGKVLTVNAGATAPEWANAGGMTLIATATPSAATTISFTSIPNTYKHLMLIWHGMYQSINTEQFMVRLNNDNASVYSYSGYAIQSTTVSNQTNNGATGFGQLNGSTAAPIALTGTSSSPISETSKGSMMIYRYTDTGDRFVEWSQTSNKTSGASPLGPITNFIKGIYSPSSGAAVSRVDFVRSATQTITGTVYLYGVS